MVTYVILFALHLLSSRRECRTCPCLTLVCTMELDGALRLLASFPTTTKLLLVLIAMTLTASTGLLSHKEGSQAHNTLLNNSTTAKKLVSHSNSEGNQNISNTNSELNVIKKKFLTTSRGENETTNKRKLEPEQENCHRANGIFSEEKTETNSSQSEQSERCKTNTTVSPQEGTQSVNNGRDIYPHRSSQRESQTPLETKDSRCSTRHRQKLTEPEGSIVWTETASPNCTTSYQWLINVPDDDGLVFDFNFVELRNGSALKILQIDEQGGRPKFPPFWRAPLVQGAVSMAPLLIRTSTILVEISRKTSIKILNTTQRSRFSLSYSAHPLQLMPPELHIGNGSLRTSSVIFNCSDSHWTIPKALQCDMIQQCVHGEDERECSYQHSACGDWVPYGNRCLKAFFQPISEFSHSTSHITMPVYAASTCRTVFRASLARLPNDLGMQLVNRILRRSGYSSASVGLRKVRPLSTSLKQLYRYMWQWGKPGSTIAYEQMAIQRMNALFDCAVYDLTVPSNLRPAACNFAPFKQSVPDGFVCIKSNSRKVKTKQMSNYIGPVHLKPAEIRTMGFATKECPDGSLVQTFHECRWKNVNINADHLTSTFPMFPCKLGRDIHYTHVCDGVDDCIDGSDELHCATPRFPPLIQASFTCNSLQNIPISKRCNGHCDCFDNSDEEDCIMCKQKTVLCPGLQCVPKGYRRYFNSCLFRGSVSSPKFKAFSPATVELDGFGMSKLRTAGTECDEGFFRCKHGLCIPTFLLNNGERDCPNGMDERIPWKNYTCPGYYRCQSSGICVHSRHVCDGIHHCPNKDDERYCDLTCPQNCKCEGYAYRCTSMFDPLKHLRTRYLDISGVFRPSLHNIQSMEYLRFLNISFCKLRHVNLTNMPQLRTLDLSFNLLTNLSSVVFVELTGLTYLYLSNNPFVKILDSKFTQFVQLSGITNLRYLYLTSTQLSTIEDDALRSLQKLKYLDIRDNHLINFGKNVFSGLSKLKKLDSDNYKLCCPYFRSEESISDCNAPMNELSSCDDLLGNWFYQISVWILAVLNIPSNIVVLLYRIFETKSKRSRICSVLVANLCLSDLLMGIYLVFIGSADVHYRHVWVSKQSEWAHSNWCKAAGVLAFLSSEVSAFIICLITLERLLVICFPLRINLHMNRRSASFACCSAWLLGLCLAFLPTMLEWDLYGENGFCLPLPITRNQFPGQEYLFTVFIYVNFFLFILVGIGQICIYRAIKRTRLCKTSKRKQQDMTIARRLMFIIATNFCCWVPICVMGIMASLGTPIPGEVNVWAALFILPFNSALNPHLYTFNGILDRYKERRMERHIKKTMSKINMEIEKWPMDKVEALLKSCLRASHVPKDKILQWMLSGQGAQAGVWKGPEITEQRELRWVGKKNSDSSPSETNSELSSLPKMTKF